MIRVLKPIGVRNGLILPFNLLLKRKHERDLMNEQIRNQHFPSKISKFEVNYYVFY